MNHNILGNTGLEVSPLCIGAWQLGGPLSFDGKPDGHPDPGERQVLAMIGELHDLGINHVDTAEQYGAGGSERRVGKATATHRDEWIISTKFGYRVGPNQARIDDSSPGTILTSLEGSLRRLNTDYIDIFLYHCAPRTADLEEASAILQKAREQGKIRFTGISTESLDLAEALHRHGLLDVVQFPTNILNEARDLTAFAGQHNIGTQIRGVMAQGRLSGKYFDHTPTWSADDNRSASPHPADFTRYAAFRELVPEGFTMGQVAIRWTLDQSAHHTICMGAKTINDYRSALQALEMPPLDATTGRRLREIATALEDR